MKKTYLSDTVTVNKPHLTNWVKKTLKQTTKIGKMLLDVSIQKNDDTKQLIEVLKVIKYLEDILFESNQIKEMDIFKKYTAPNKKKLLFIDEAKPVIQYECNGSIIKIGTANKPSDKGETVGIEIIDVNNVHTGAYEASLIRAGISAGIRYCTKAGIPPKARGAE